MKKLLLLSATFLALFSCTKTVRDTPSQQITRGLASVTQRTFILDGDSVDVAVLAEPTVICQSYGNGETPQNCNIYINFTCTLSKPVNGFVKVELERNNQPQQEKREVTEPGNDGQDTPDPGAHVFLNIAPNMKKMSFSSTLSNINNQAVPENEFRIVSVTRFTPVD